MDAPALHPVLPEGWTRSDDEYVRRGAEPGTFLRVQHLTETAPPNLGWAWTISRKGAPSEVSMVYLPTFVAAVQDVERTYCGSRPRRMP